MAQRAEGVFCGSASRPCDGVPRIRCSSLPSALFPPATTGAILAQYAAPGARPPFDQLPQGQAARGACLVTAPSTAAGGTALSRELADFLIEYSIALHKNAIYPEGHPLLGTAVRGLLNRLNALLKLDRESLSIGVARRQLIIEGVATDPNHPLLRELASRLHRHHLGAVRFSTGITEDELSDFLATVAVDASRMDLPLGLGDSDALNKWSHARLFPLTFEQLELLDDDPDDDDGMDGRSAGGARSAALWIGLARAALAREATADEEMPSTDPVLVAQAIDEHGRDVAYDQVVVGYMLQIAEELKTKEGKEAAALKKRVSRMVSSLRPDTLNRLLEMGGDNIQRNKFVLNANAGMSVDAVVDIVQAAADQSKQTISHSMVRLLSKFAAHAEHGEAKSRPQMDEALREHVQRLIGEWTLDDPNPDAYRLALEGMAKAQSLYAGVDRYPAEPKRLLAMALEVESAGDAVWRAVDQLTAQGELGAVFDLADQASESFARDSVVEYIATPDRLHQLLQADTLDLPLLTRVSNQLKHAAVEPLLDALEIADDRKASQLVEIIAGIGPEVGPTVMARLAATRWASQRYLLLIITKLAQWPERFAPTDWLRHPDATVRREAQRMTFKVDALRDEGIRIGLLDHDDRNVSNALGAAARNCPPDAVRILLERVDDASMPVPLQPLAVKVAASTRLPSLVPWLLAKVEGKKGFFGKKLADTNPVMLASLEALAQHFPDRPDVSEVIALAAKSRDDELRQAVTRRASTQVRPSTILRAIEE